MGLKSMNPQDNCAAGHGRQNQELSRPGLPPKQLPPELHLKFENKVALNCVSTIVAKCFWAMKWKFCRFFMNLSACQASSCLQIPQLKDGHLEFWEALETYVYICS